MNSAAPPPNGRRASAVWMPLVLLFLAWGCGGAVQGDSSAEDGYVPPVLLTPPEDPLPVVRVADTRGILNSARHLRSELQRFADTASPDARSYPAARCCPQVLRDLLVRGHRLDAGAVEEGDRVVPILERLVNEPALRHAPGLVDLVLKRIPSPGAGGPPS